MLRAGNHAFAREMDALVPDHFAVANDQDAVPRSGKFLALFKHAGARPRIFSACGGQTERRAARRQDGLPPVQPGARAARV